MFGVSLHNGKSTSFDLNEYLQITNIICKELNSKLNLSEFTIDTIEECVESGKHDILSIKLQRTETGKSRQLITYNLQETADCIEKNFEEILKKITLLDKHERIKQDMLKSLTNYQLKDIEKICKQNLNEGIKISNFLISIKKESKLFAEQINHIMSEMFLIEKEKVYTKKIGMMVKHQDSISSILKKLLILTPSEKNNYSIQELEDNILQQLKLSENTMHVLLQSNRSLELDINEFQQRRVQILSESSNNIDSEIIVINKCLELLIDHEKFKHQIIESNPRSLDLLKYDLDSFKIKLEEEEDVLKGFCKLAKLPAKIPEVTLFMTLSEYIDTDKKRLEIYEKCLKNIPRIDSLAKNLQSYAYKISEITNSLDYIKKILKPGDKALEIEIEKLKNELSDLRIESLEENNHSELTEFFIFIDNSLETCACILKNLSKQLPKNVPALKKLEKLNEFMKSSNFTVEVLAKMYGKEEKYRRMIDTQDIPRLEIELERDFKLKWK